MSVSTKGVIKISVLSLLLLAVYFGLESTLILQQYIHVSMPWIIVFYWLQSVTIHTLVIFSKNTLSADFSLILMGGFTMRLVTALMVVVIVVFMGIENHEMYIVNFFAIYLLYLVFEIVMVLSNLRSNLK